MKFIVDIEAKKTWWFDGMLMGYHWDIMGICDTDFSYDKKWDLKRKICRSTWPTISYIISSHEY